MKAEKEGRGMGRWGDWRQMNEDGEPEGRGVEI